MLRERGLAEARGLEREVLDVEIRQDLLLKGRRQLPGVQQSLSYPLEWLLHMALPILNDSAAFLKIEIHANLK